MMDISHGNYPAQDTKSKSRWTTTPHHHLIRLSALTSMSSALARYESFLIQNVSTISSLESTLRSVTWFLPGRFRDADLVSEACQFISPSFPHPSPDIFVIVSSLLNTLSLYHDTLLNRAIGNEPRYKPLLPPSLHSRFTRAWADTHVRYRWTARTLEIIRFTGLLLEMILRRRASTKFRWRAITLLEAIK